jgi:hypothetical protein
MGLWLILLKVNHDVYAFWNINKVEVNTIAPLSADKVKIRWQNGNQDITVFDGKPTNSIPNEYGENDFGLSYDNSHELQFRQFKFNRHHQHSYSFMFFKKGDSIMVYTEIVGQDGQGFLAPMK